LIPRFHQWISQYYPGTKLAFSEYSIDSGNKLITDALAEADVLGIFGQQGVDFANMWTPPAPTDPIAYAFRLFRNYDGAGGQFGSTGVSAVSSNPGNLSIYAAVRASDGALTIVVINKTTAAIESSVSLADYASSSTAEVYSYSNANLTQITAEGTTPIVAGAIGYTFPSYSATVFVVVESAQTAALTTPTPGSTLTASSEKFTWDTATGATGYLLELGSTGVGSYNLYYSGSTTATSVTATGLPANGETIYARLLTNDGGTWMHTDYTYKAVTEAQAALTSPTPGSTLTASSEKFTWGSASGATGYILELGSTGVGSYNLYYSGSTTATSVTATGLPANGETIYARLLTNNGGTWLHTDYTYKAVTEAQAALTSPAPGSTLTASSEKFTWDTASGASGYILELGSTGVGSYNLYYSGSTTATSVTATGLPTNGETIYARLLTNNGGTWLHTDYTYKAAP
jgi:hypothetical protein